MQEFVDRSSEGQMSRNSDEVVTYALLDNGSTASFCSEDLLAKLGIAARKCQISVATISNVMENCDSAVASLKIMDLNKTVSIVVPQAFVVKKLNVSKDAVASQTDVDSWTYLSDLVLPTRLEDCTVDLLIGVDVPEALQPEEIRRGEPGGPFAVRTKFGWTLNGPLGQTEVAAAQCGMTSTNQPTDFLSEQLKKYFNHEFDDCISNDRKLMSANDKKALEVFEESAKLNNGHYVLAIPWKNPQPCLPNNRSLAESRLTYLKRKLLKNKDLQVKYTEFIEDLQVKGYSRTVPEEKLHENNGKVRVKEDDVSALRFLWFPNGDLSKDPEERQMLVHLFGGIWSPSCAAFALQKTAEDHKAHFKDGVISTVKRNFYVDDLLKSELKKIDVEKDLLPVNRALGVQWNVSSDSFQYDVNIPAREVTKRGILSFVSSIYDPLGIVAPFVLTAKIILEELCREKLGWDDEIPRTAINRWNSWIKELPNLVRLAVPRCLQPENFGEVKEWSYIISVMPQRMDMVQYHM
eukprot:gene19620-biopygen13889